MAGVPLWEFRKMLSGENTIRRPPVAGRSQQAVHRTAFVGDVLKGVPLRAEGFPKRRCQFESVAAERRI